MQKCACENKTLLAWIKPGELLRDRCNVHRVFEQTTNDGSMMAYSSRPAPEACHQLGREAAIKELAQAWMLYLGPQPLKIGLKLCQGTTCPKDKKVDGR